MLTDPGFAPGARCGHGVERRLSPCPPCAAAEAARLTVKVGDRVLLDDGFLVQGVVGTVASIDPSEEDFGAEYGPSSDYDLVVIAEDGDSAYCRHQIAEVLTRG